MDNFSYCAAIRTLGTAGDKYLQTLKSLEDQTVKPKKIIIYIAEGYSLPKETIGIEQYVYVKKGMVAQRALPYDEIDTEYGLFLDDDVSFPPDMVEKLYRGLREFDGDCISPNVFPNHNMPFKKKIGAMFGAFCFPRRPDDWAFKIQRNAAYTYNNRPSRAVYQSQSASFNCFFCKMNVYRQIDYRDEIWLDRFRYALGDDLLFYYKLHINGYKLLVHYSAGCVHLDAQSGRRPYSAERIKSVGELSFITWHRICYNLTRNTVYDKFLSIASYSLRIVFRSLFHMINGLKQGKLAEPVHYWSGLTAGIKFVHSEEYKKIPNFDLAHRNNV